jgi:hypothetical protein
MEGDTESDEEPPVESAMDAGEPSFAKNSPGESSEDEDSDGAANGAGDSQVKGPWVCGDCGKDFNWESRLKQHMKIHLDTKTYDCKTCGKVYKCMQDLQAHWRYFSETCGEVYAQKRNLQIDMRTNVCETCGKGYKEKTNLQQHWMKHIETCGAVYVEKQTSKTFACESCGKSFTNKNNRQQHWRNNRDTCGRGYTFKDKIARKHY